MDSGEPQRDHDSDHHDSDPPSTPSDDEGIAALDDKGAETPRTTHDSMVTVRLSEPPSLSLDTNAHGDGGAEDTDDPDEFGAPLQRQPKAHDSSSTSAPRNSTTTLSSNEASRNLQDELGDCNTDDGEASSSEDEVNWEELEKSEDAQSKDDETDNSTAMLLARLEQENAKLATNPKSVKVQAGETSTTTKPRPPSMAQLRQMVTGPTPPALRYSLLPAPPMTDLEFFAALVKDYQQTAARLPTLLSNKVRKGIPPPLRGVVWQSMAGGRDVALEEQYDRFGGESSPYEFIIGKDLGRSFPGVDMFRDPEGDGQRMLGRVLRAFSLHDTKIGYCQGLAFLVGPLLMHMPDKQAFCVLVRLMDNYDLRGCFLPDLSGLHVRIYQFRELLRASLPALASHLEELQVDPAYVSQWFLSFFAVTCPLPMLFRIYDVVFAEGASETLMRVGLSLMRKNEARLLACDELEDVMQLLLSRSLWDCYHYNADEFVQDFVSLSGVVTREKLALLEKGYKESLIATASVARSSAITTAASRFLDRIWASSTASPPKTTTLNPAPSAAAASRPASTLRRSTSKQSLASTLNSIEASSASITSSSSTEATTVSRQSLSNAEEHASSRESTPVGPKAAANTTDERYLHSQIEDLLTALSELQRNHALLSNQLQREREERDEDKKAVRSLLDGLRRKASTDSVDTDASVSTAKPGSMTEAMEEEETDDEDSKDNVNPKQDSSQDEEKNERGEEVQPETEAGTEAENLPSTTDLEMLLDRVDSRFRTDGKKNRSSIQQTKTQLRDELLNTKDQLISAVSHSQELSRRIHDQDQEMGLLKDQLKESQRHARSLHTDKQRLEKQVSSLKARSSACSMGEPSSREAEADWATKSASGGLRELKLGRSKSTPSQGGGFGKRVSSLPQPRDSSLTPTASNTAAAGSGEANGTTTPTNEHEALLLELVQAKTSEAMARQEAEEAKQKLEALRKAHGLASVDSPGAAPSSGAMGVFGRLTGQGSWQAVAGEGGGSGTGKETGGASGSGGAVVAAQGSATSGVSSGSGGFWGWRR